MKVTLINSTDKGGGAAIACLRLAESLIKNKIDCKVLVQKQKGENRSWLIKCINTYLDKVKYVLRVKIEETIISKYKPQKIYNFSLAKFGLNINNKKIIKASNILHLHWINDGFLSVNNINKLFELNIPVIWTMHDMWPFTGGCHYSEGCQKYMTFCTSCPVLGSNIENDISWNVWNKKNLLLKNNNLTLIAPSNWLADLARKSSLFGNCKIHVIPNAINTTIYKPIEKKIARNFFNIDNKKFVILFGAINAINDERKGFNYLIKALELVSQKINQDDIEICIYGANNIPSNIKLPFSIKILGKLNKDIELVNAYNAADIFILPSLQDNLPNTIMESLACGTPIVAFNIGGIPDMICHLKTGYLAEPKSSKDLANGILNFYNGREFLNAFSNAAREYALQNYSFEKIAVQHIKLYNSLLKKS